jgi:selenide, water dikinase
MSSEEIKLTEYSHGAGCGCKISPKLLSSILASNIKTLHFPQLLVGNETKDDAAVYAIDDERVIISTTDFFMPIVDDPFKFGGIAAVNAISDIYAMGGTPIMAVAILGWPINKIPAEIASKVLDGGRDACNRAGIPLAGGHSIDAPEPIFGLAVTGIANRKDIKANNTAKEGCELYLTKPIGVGIISTAQKKGLVKKEDIDIAIAQMLQLNSIGKELGKLSGVTSITDVTGFGLMGHLIEMCEGSGLSAQVDFSKVPVLEAAKSYLAMGAVPGGTQRNFDSYGEKIKNMNELQRNLLCDPQTSGGLLVAVQPDSKESFLSLTNQHGMQLQSFGKLISKSDFVIEVV